MEESKVGRKRDELDGNERKWSIRRIENKIFKRRISLRRENGKKKGEVEVLELMKKVSGEVGRNKVEKEDWEKGMERWEDLGREMKLRMVKKEDGVVVRKMGNEGEWIIGIKLVEDLKWVEGENISDEDWNGGRREVGKVEKLRKEVVVGIK